MMAGHGSPRPEDRANHPGRKVHLESLGNQMSRAKESPGATGNLDPNNISQVEVGRMLHWSNAAKWSAPSKGGSLAGHADADSFKKTYYQGGWSGA